MTEMTTGAVISILTLVLVFTFDVWVYRDAGERQRRGDPVGVSLASFRVDTPEAWFLGCLVLWVVFVPLYLTASGRNPFAHSG